MTWRILLVDDDARFARALGGALQRAGYDVAHAATARAALSAPPCDLVLLDQLPDADGIEVCRRLRGRGDVGIIVLSSRREEHIRVTGLRSGGDDYLVKPVSFAELHARVEAVPRRARPQAGVQVAGRLRVDLDRHEVFVEDVPITLTREEFQLLAVLATRPGR